MNIIIGIILATIISLLNFVIVDTYFGLPEMPGVQGANIVGHDIQERKGDLAGGSSKETYYVHQMHQQEH